ncbi:MAG TPA: sn-glycerol-3-phosphate ABC transporter ATP-binding protein UgpC [Roseiarcus sp.]|nr:sn-glycerol-3-phosphate ABC transporter ATP-binding protein UgpC [Roseiarcus sp.]
MAGLELERVVKRFGEVEVIHGVSMRIEDGEFAVLVGPSGCGKSTLLRMIAGLDSVSSGIIRIGGRTVNHVAPKDRDIAMVFQNYALYPHMTVARNMSFALEIAGAPKSVRDEKVARAAEILGLQTLLGRFPRQLSGGQRQRVAMGRAIVRDPQVFLFDEPLSNLDAKLRVQMRAEIKNLQQRLSATAVYVTHDQIEAMTMADRIVVLRDGSVEQIGSPLEVYDRPANSFVGGFIGSPAMNMLNGRIEGGDRPRFLTNDGLAIVLPSAPHAALGRAITLGVRPEHLTVGGPSAFAAQVEIVEPTGAETVLNVSWGSASLVCVLHARVAARPGETLPLGFDGAPLHFFDAATGVALAD